MTRIYIIYRYFQHEENRIIEIHLNEEKARKKVKELNKSYKELEKKGLRARRPIDEYFIEIYEAVN